MQNAIMGSITIRNVPDDVRDELASRARAAGQSLQEYLSHRLAELARQPDVASLIDHARERARRTGTRVSVEDILAARDADRQ